MTRSRFTRSLPFARFSFRAVATSDRREPAVWGTPVGDLAVPEKMARTGALHQGVFAAPRGGNATSPQRPVARASAAPQVSRVGAPTQRGGPANEGGIMDDKVKC